MTRATSTTVVRAQQGSTKLREINQSVRRTLRGAASVEATERTAGRQFRGCENKTHEAGEEVK